MKKKQRGTGSVWKEGSGYRSRDPVGKRKWFPTRKAAEHWLRGRRAIVRRQGTDVLRPHGKRADITFGQFWTYYSAGPMKQKPAGTRRIERQAWKRCRKWIPAGRTNGLWEVQRIAKATTNLVERYKAFRLPSGNSQATIAQELALLRYLANLAVEMGLCPAPRLRWGVPRPVARKLALLSEVDFKKLLTAANSRQRALLRWLWDTGARPNELLVIRREEFLIDLGTVRIPTPKTSRQKSTASRVFYLTPEMISTIEARDRWLQEIIDSKKGNFGIGPTQARAQLESEWLFPNARGTRMAKNSYRPTLNSAFEKAGIARRDFYAIRHAFHTRWLASGGDPVTLSKLTGTSVEMISRTYGHLDRDWVRQIQDRMRGQSNQDPEVREGPECGYGHGLPNLKAS